MRRTFLPFGAVFLAVLSCGRPPSRRADNEILFTLSQTPTSTDARYELLTLSGAGQVHEEADDECYFEPLDRRLGPVRVEDGIATWKTPLASDDGIVVRANEPPAHVDFQTWRTGDEITFVAHGFAMPEPKPLSFVAPPAELEILAPLDGAITVDADRDLEVTWRPPARATEANVSVSLDSDSHDRVICFFASAPGRAVVPGHLLAVLRARSAVKEGTMKIGTHRQTNVPGPGSWMIYVVASHFARIQTFSIR